MKFRYQAKLKNGEMQIGELESPSREAAIILLNKYNFSLISLEEVGPGTSIFGFWGKFSKKDHLMFFRQLSIMFESQISLLEALKTFLVQSPNKYFKEILFKIIKDVEGGASFSIALSNFPEIFSPFEIAMVKTGEKIGKLAQTLKYLSDYLEKEYYLINEVKSAFTYPAIVMGLMLVVVSALIFLIIPRLKDVFEGLPLSPITQFVFSASSFITHWWWLIIFFIGSLIAALYSYFQTKGIKKIFDEAILDIPLIGEVAKMFFISRISRNISTLMSSGVYVNEALEISSEIINNSVYKRALIEASEDVKKGENLSSSLEKSGEIFLPVFIQIIKVGEKTGNLDTVLGDLSNFYEIETERGIKTLVTFLEPLLIVFTGLIVGLIMIAVLLPLYQTITQM